MRAWPGYISPSEGCVAAASKLGAEPGEGREGAVMEDVEEGEVGQFAAEQEENRVQKIAEL